jgi:hypothetical protein
MQLQIDEHRQMTTAHPPADAEVTESFERYDQAVSASVERCQRGDVIRIPSQYVQRFCNFGKMIVHNGDMAACVKR